MMPKWYIIMYFFALFTKKEDCVVCAELDPADDPSNIIRPCPDLDLNCIRQYFATNSNCEVAEGPLPDPLYIGDHIVKYSNANITLLLTNVRITGLDGEIVEFYVNTVTQKVVLAMRTKNLAMASRKGVMMFNRKDKEPIVRSDHVECGYGIATLTAVFDSIDELDLDKMEVSTFAEDGYAPYSLGPNFSNTTDPVAKKEYDELLNTLPLAAQLELSWLELKLMTSFIQSLICSFDEEL